jgi:hypothetical protein
MFNKFWNIFIISPKCGKNIKLFFNQMLFQSNFWQNNQNNLPHGNFNGKKSLETLLATLHISIKKFVTKQQA